MGKWKKVNIKTRNIIILIGSVLTIVTIFYFIKDQVFLTDDEKQTRIANVYVNKGPDAAITEIEKYYKYDKKKMNIAKGVISENEKKKLKHPVPIGDNKPNLTVNDLQIVETKQETRGNYSYVTGSVKNNGKVPTRYYEIYINYCDANGNILITDRTNSTIELQPNASNSFKIMSRMVDGVDKYNVYVNKVVAK